MWSIMAFDRSSPFTYGKVMAVSPAAVMLDVKFVVQPSGAARAKRESVKNVHAFAEGELAMHSDDQLDVLKWTSGDEIAVTYDHMSDAGFVSRSEPWRQIESAAVVVTSATGLWVRDAVYRP